MVSSQRLQLWSVARVYGALDACHVEKTLPTTYEGSRRYPILEYSTAVFAHEYRPDDSSGLTRKDRLQPGLMPERGRTYSTHQPRKNIGIFGLDPVLVIKTASSLWNPNNTIFRRVCAFYASQRRKTP